MTSIYRTAYPRFHANQKLRTKELEADYSLTNAELLYIKQNIRGDSLRLGFAVLLKVFQRMGYFPAIDSIPETVVKHIREQIHYIKQSTEFTYEHESSFNRHRRRVYGYLKIKRWSKNEDKSFGQSDNQSRSHAIKIAYNAAQTMNFTADIINIVIEDLRKNKYELPAFSQLSRLVKHVRFLVNNKIFRDIYQQLNPHQIAMLDALLEVKPDYNRTGYNGLKQLPKKPTISHFRELIKHHDWIMSMDGIGKYVETISKVKLQQFAEQAGSLDASDLKNFTPSKRYALMICLLFQAQCRAKEALGTTFYKTMTKMHKKAREKLEEIKENTAQKTDDLLTLFSDILVDFKEKKPAKKLLNSVIGKLDDKGGAATLHADCEKAVACNSKNHLPLIWEFYENKRPTLFKLLHALNLQSATQNDSLIKAMHTMLDNEDKKSEYLDIHINLSFTTESWRKLILRKDNEKILVARRYLEICIFSHLAEYLHSGDIYINGAESFADYRKELLSWDECLALLNGYCKKANIPNNAKEFIDLVRTNFINVADKVDRTYPEIEEFSIDDRGVPTLKRRGPKKRPPSAIWLANKIKERMPERNLLDILCSTHHYTGWAHIFGPISGSDPKIDNAIEKYIPLANEKAKFGAMI